MRTGKDPEEGLGSAAGERANVEDKGIVAGGMAAKTRKVRQTVHHICPLYAFFSRSILKGTGTQKMIF